MNFQERILAFVQIFFESLPVSSSTHVFLAKIFLNRRLCNPVSLGESTFFLWHLPSLLIFASFVFGCLALDYKKFCRAKRKDFWPLFFKSGFLIGASCLPIAFFHLFLKTKFTLGFSKFLVVGFLFSGVMLLSIKLLPKRHKHWAEISIFDAAIGGAAQILSLIPGVSRMAMTTTAFYALGYSSRESLLLSASQQCILTLAMVTKIIIKHKITINLLGITNLFDALTIGAATIFGALNLYATVKIVKSRRTEIFFVYYILLAFVILKIA